MSSAQGSSDLQNLEVRSECGASSSASRRSTRSHVSLAAAEARAKAEAARTRADYTKRQIEMKVERARLDAMLTALQEEGEAESALAAAKTLEAAAEAEAIKDGASIVSNPLAPSAEPARRTEEYIDSHFDRRQEPPVEQPGSKAAPIFNGQLHPESITIESQAPPPHPPQNFPSFSAQAPQTTVAMTFPRPSYLTNVAEHCHADNRGQTNGPAPSRSDISDLTAHLTRRDLLTAGLKVFDNRPENYRAWKASFHNVTQGLNLKPSEKLDLLTRWLGGESLQHATRIRAVHIDDPSAGLNLVWQRLDKKYGSPEAIEASLFSRLENFPKIGNREYTKLQELADLLTEVRAAKLEGSVFMVSVAGIAMISGFGLTMATAKRKHPGSFSKGILPNPSVSIHESGASLGMRALLWGSLFAVTGFGTLTFAVCKVMGFNSVEDFKKKFQSVAPRVRRNPNSEPEEVTLRKLHQEILEEDT